MNKRTHACSVLLALLCLLAVLGCQRRPVATPIAAEKNLAVMGFTQPATDRAALAGYLPNDSETVKPSTLATLDRTLLEALSAESRRTIVGPGKTRECATQSGDLGDGRHASLGFHLKVGQCLGVDYLLVPQLVYWHERVGGPGGVSEPASVMLDMYVLDIKEQGVAARYRFDETQSSLTDNMLTLPKFVERGPKWLSATELAQWGVQDGLKALGLR